MSGFRLSSLRRRPALVLAALLVANATGGVAAASGQPHAGDLHAINVITATHSAVMTVQLRRSAEVAVSALVPPAGIRVDGKGRIFGVALVRTTPGTQPLSEIVAFGINALGGNGCFSAGCSPTSPRFGLATSLPAQFSQGFQLPVTTTGPNQTVTYRLPVGTYTIYAVADGGPMTARINLRGAPAGVAHLSPTKVIQPQFESATPGLAGTSVAPPDAYSAGATHRISGAGGLIISSMWQSYAAHVNTEMGTCYYVSTDSASQPGPPAGTFLAGCPNGNSGPTTIFNSVAGDALPQGFHEGVGINGWAFVAGGASVSVGNYSDGVYAPDYSSPSALLWLSYDQGTAPSGSLTASTAVIHPDAAGYPSGEAHTERR